MLSGGLQSILLKVQKPYLNSRQKKKNYWIAGRDFRGLAKCYGYVLAGTSGAVQAIKERSAEM
jgi:hypothetical protein